VWRKAGRLPDFAAGTAVNQPFASLSLVDICRYRAGICRSNVRMSRSYLKTSCSYLTASHSHLNTNRSYLDTSGSYLPTSCSSALPSDWAADANRRDLLFSKALSNKASAHFLRHKVVSPVLDRKTAKD
jgi:hypothetical protein